MFTALLPVTLTGARGTMTIWCPFGGVAALVILVDSADAVAHRLSGNVPRQP